MVHVYAWHQHFRRHFRECGRERDIERERQGDREGDERLLYFVKEYETIGYIYIKEGERKRGWELNT